jgi:hypothetical protein
MDDQHAEHGALPEKKIWPQTWRACIHGRGSRTRPTVPFPGSANPGSILVLYLTCTRYLSHL